MQNDIQANVDRIEDLLSMHGPNLGESREGLIRIVFDPPVGMRFLALDDPPLVVVDF